MAVAVRSGNAAAWAFAPAGADVLRGDGNDEDEEGQQADRDDEEAHARTVAPVC